MLDHRLNTFHMLEGLVHPFSKKIQVVTYYLTNPQFCYNQASISYFVNHGPQMAGTLVLMVLFESLGHDCDPRYLKPTILEILGTFRLDQNG